MPWEAHYEVEEILLSEESVVHGNGDFGMEEKEDDFETEHLKFTKEWVFFTFTWREWIREVGLFHIGHQGGPYRPPISLVLAYIFDLSLGEKQSHVFLDLVEVLLRESKWRLKDENCNPY